MQQFFEPFNNSFWIAKNENIPFLSQCFTFLLEKYIEAVREGSQQDQKPIVLERLSFILAIFTFIGHDPFSNEKEESAQNLAQIEGEFLANTFKMIDFINSQKVKEYTKKEKLLHLCIIMFLEQYFNVTLDKVDINEQMVMVSESNKYQSMITHFDYQDDYKTLLKIGIIRSLSNTRIPDHDIINYSLEFLRVLFQRVKRQIERKKFTELPFLEIIQEFVEKYLNYTVLSDLQFCKYRTKIFEMVAFIWVDDYFDSYTKQSIKIVQNLQNTHFEKGVTKQGILMYVRDLIGLNNSIEVGKIFQQHYRNIEKQLSQIIHISKEQQFIQDPLIANAILDLFLSLTPNKSSRLAIDTNSLMNLQLFKLVAEFSIDFLYHLQNAVQVQDQNNNNFKDFGKIVHKLWKNLYEILHGSYVHFSVFPLFQDQISCNLIRSHLRFIFHVQNAVTLFPKYEDTMHDILFKLTESQMDFLFTNVDLDSLLYFWNSFKNLIQMQADNYFKMQNKGDQPTLAKAIMSCFQIHQFILEELQISLCEEHTTKIKKFLLASFDATKKIIEIQFDIMLASPNSKSKIFYNAIKFYFVLYLIDQTYIINLHDYIVSKFPSLQQSIDAEMSDIFKSVDKTFNLTMEEKFIGKIKSFVKKLQQSMV